ncbi:MAG: WhiB family transcriptional regulator [Acidimicrobiales bacterium]
MPDLVSASSVTGDEWSDIGELFDLVRRRPAFHADAACREAPPEVSWFIERGGDPGPAKAICARCLVVADCRAWALDQGSELEGIWAGMSKRDRMAERRLAA